MHKLLLAASLLLLVAGCGDGGDDVIVLKNGSHRTGTLQSCVNGDCEMSGRTIPQATIAWIGLGQAKSNPPAPHDPTADEIRLSDGAVHPESMTSIDSSRVTAVPDSYDRKAVAWIYLAAPEMAADAAPAPDGCRHAIYHYDVHVAGYRSTVDARPAGSGYTGALSITFDWTAEWSNVPLGVTQCPATLEILMPVGKGGGADPTRNPAIGEMHLKYEYDDSQRDTGAVAGDIYTDTFRGQPPCHIFKDIRLPANMWLMAGGLIGASTQGRMPSVSFDFATVAASMPEMASSKECPPGPEGIGRDIQGARATNYDDSLGKDSHAALREQGTLKPVHGLNWNIADAAIGLTKQDVPYPPFRFPVDALVAGKGFSLDSKKQIITLQDSLGHVTDRMVVTFTPVGRYRAPNLDNQPPSGWHALVRSAEDALLRLFK